MICECERFFAPRYTRVTEYEAERQLSPTYDKVGPRCCAALLSVTRV
jgi:hypothetical protein